MSVRGRPIDWRLVATWTGLLALSVLAHAYVEASDRSPRLSFADALAQEISSHLVLGLLLPALYWLHRRFPLTGGWRNLALRISLVVPFSLLHTLGLIGLRLVWFVAILDRPYALPVTWSRLFYEFNKDIVTYLMLNAAIVALELILAPKPMPQAAALPPVPARPERFAVRKRGGREVMIEVDDIDRVEAAGNYAILHVGGERLEIRSSLSRLEAELDPRRFVRVHKSHLVNIARVAEVTPWVSGDWRIRLQDGAELNLSRRYRERFEALAPVKS